MSVIQKTHVAVLFLLGVLAGCGSAPNLSNQFGAPLPGTVSATVNPQVALYSITPASAGTVTVHFGTTLNYGLETWSVPSGGGGAPVSIFVAGMRADTTYHMRAFIQYQNGTSATDVDHTFTTGHYPANTLPKITATTGAGQTPQPGVEMLNPLTGDGPTGIKGGAGIIVTDLNGNVLWDYNPPTDLGNAQWAAPKLLPNGDYIAYAGVSPSRSLYGTVPPNAANLVREFDLAGDTIKQITMTQLNAEMKAANYNIPLIEFSHDVTVLPNGHWLVIATTFKKVTLTGHTAPTKVLGDVVVDLDTNLKPVWVWDEFDHLDVNRHPENFPDWTHTNALIYSRNDGNIIVSMRHQNWLVKVDYDNGAGAGDTIWRLGYQGDFKLVGGTSPTGWFTGQHGPSFTTTNTTGIFGLTLMDNGDFRNFPPGSPCDVAFRLRPSSCLYSTVPVFQINEAAKTATLEFDQVLSPSLYNFFGGNAEKLANGDIEYNLCGLPGIPNSEVFEVTDQSTPQTVWSLKVAGEYVYRGYRMPSLYPGVQW